MKSLCSILAMFFILSTVQASISPKLLPVNVDISDKARLQRGARFFMNYCSGCHSLKYLRYNRMAKDLGLTTFDGEVDTDLLKNNLIFTKASIQDPIQIAMPEVDARKWFGKMPKDLSLSARERGSDWIYTYLKSFYKDDSRPFGANNLLIPETAMPNVLEPLKGKTMLTKSNELVLIEPGSMSEHEFESSLVDLVTFLTYVGEPEVLTRAHIGYFVLVFLAVFAAFAYQLKKSYWRKIH